VQTVLGAAKLVRETKVHPAVLRDAVVTPGGTTIAAIHELEKHGLRSMLISAVETATARSKEIGAQIVERFSKNLPPAGTPSAHAKAARSASGKSKPSGPASPARKRSR
jgi:hypothetical protein